MGCPTWDGGRPMSRDGGCLNPENLDNISGMLVAIASPSPFLCDSIGPSPSPGCPICFIGIGIISKRMENSGSGGMGTGGSIDLSPG